MNPSRKNNFIAKAPSTLAIYEGKAISTESPAFTDRRKLRDSIKREKMKKFPKGLGWEGDFSSFLFI
jgi:hypothetical protein